MLLLYASVLLLLVTGGQGKTERKTEEPVVFKRGDNVAKFVEKHKHNTTLKLADDVKRLILNGDQVDSDKIRDFLLSKKTIEGCILLINLRSQKQLMLGTLTKITNTCGDDYSFVVMNSDLFVFYVQGVFSKGNGLQLRANRQLKPGGLATLRRDGNDIQNPGAEECFVDPFGDWPSLDRILSDEKCKKHIGVLKISRKLLEVEQLSIKVNITDRLKSFEGSIQLIDLDISQLPDGLADFQFTKKSFFGASSVVQGCYDLCLKEDEQKKLIDRGYAIDSYTKDTFCDKTCHISTDSSLSSVAHQISSKKCEIVFGALQFHDAGPSKDLLPLLHNIKEIRGQLSLVNMENVTEIDFFPNLKRIVTRRQMTALVVRENNDLLSISFPVLDRVFSRAHRVYLFLDNAYLEPSKCREAHKRVNNAGRWRGIFEDPVWMYEEWPEEHSAKRYRFNPNAKEFPYKF